MGWLHLSDGQGVDGNFPGMAQCGLPRLGWDGKRQETWWVNWIEVGGSGKRERCDCSSRNHLWAVMAAMLTLVRHPARVTSLVLEYHDGGWIQRPYHSDPPTTQQSPTRGQPPRRAEATVTVTVAVTMIQSGAAAGRRGHDDHGDDVQVHEDPPATGCSARCPPHDTVHTIVTMGRSRMVIGRLTTCSFWTTLTTRLTQTTKNCADLRTNTPLPVTLPAQGCAP